MINETEKEEEILEALKTIGESMFERVIFCLEQHKELNELPLRTHILGEGPTLHNRAISLINEVKEVYPENGLKIIKKEIIETLESTEKIVKKRLETV